MTQNPAPPRKRGLTLLETTALSLVLVILSASVTASLLSRRVQEVMEEQDPLPQILAERYGRDKFSQHDEEWIIRDYFQDRRNGVFLDVGANHFRHHSNTYFLETSLGWSGIAVDALSEFAADYQQHRPRTRFVAMYASDVVDSTVQFFVSDKNLVSSFDREFTKRYGPEGKPREVPTTTLNSVLEQARIDRIDLLSMDIELAEPKALAGFDIRRFKPALVCIEAHPEVRQQILDYFVGAGYTLVGKYLRADPHNLYFRPMD